MDPNAVATLRHNRDWTVLDEDIHQVSSERLLHVAGLKQGQMDVLIGGPPCQPFSKSGYWATGDSLRLEDSRAGTLGAYLRVLRDSLPRVFLLENVPGLIYRNKSEGLELISQAVCQINSECNTQYSLSMAKLNAADFGVPQQRERVFIIGSRDGRQFRFPDPTHRTDQDGNAEPSEVRRHVNTWDVLCDLEDDDDPALNLRGKWADLLPSIPEGQNYLWHTSRGGGESLFGWRRRYWSFLLKLSKCQPSWTLQAQPGPAIGPFHWKNRKLSGRELCRLQTMPDSYEVVGSQSAIQRQVGNAVPSALAEVLARSIREQLLKQKLDQGPRLVPQCRADCPRAEEIEQVPEKYLPLIGDHMDHPGTGKGYAAAKRGRRASSKRPMVSVAR